MTPTVIDARTTLQIVIRAATLADVPALVTMGRQQLAASYGDLVAEAPGALAATAAQLVTGSASVVFVAERDGAVIGLIALVVAPHFLSGVRTAGEVMWWMDPAARGTGLALLRAAERWATEQGAAALQVTAPADALGVRVGRLYQHRGYRALETSYQRAIA